MTNGDTALRSRLLISLALAAAIAAPWLLTDFETFQFTQILVYAVAILGLNLLTGFNGQISLGHGAFYGIGAYAEAILVSHYGAPYWAALPLAALICFAAGFSFGFPALKLEGHYLALATFALALAVPQLLKYQKFEGWTGGVQGIFIDKPEAPAHIPVNPDQWIYYVVLAVAVAMFGLAHNLTNGRFGRAIMAVRDNPTAAEAMGVNLGLYKTTTFGLSAFFTGAAGALSTVVIQFVAPDSFTLFLSIYLFVGLVIGGIGSIFGAFIGGAFIVLAPNLTGEISKAATGVIYGALLVVFMYLLPGGAWAVVGKVARWGLRAGAKPDPIA